MGRRMFAAHLAHDRHGAIRKRLGACKAAARGLLNYKGQLLPGRAMDVDGIGKDFAPLVEEFFATGSFTYYGVDYRGDNAAVETFFNMSPVEQITEAQRIVAEILLKEQADKEAAQARKAAREAKKEEKEREKEDKKREREEEKRLKEEERKRKAKEKEREKEEKKKRKEEERAAKKPKKA
ncbi:hypothetical protein DFJ74DRAFT_765404 [Hyaloraphidium curvatum]|nr:hypothetical protein DFJ74DRAFT_765404 [Hyaloraphidium curvatum]